MFESQMKEHRGVKIPYTPDGWQLYDKPGNHHAALALYNASAEAIDLIADAKIADLKTIRKTARDRIYEELERWSDWGAADSEGFDEAHDILERAYVTFGLKGEW
jgi:hypothetical protein